MNEIELRKKIVDMGNKLVEKKLTYGSSGNISCRLDEERILITPSNIPYEKIEPQDILIVDFNGNVEGEKNPSIETPMHLAIYKQRKDVKAIIHFHSLYAMAVASSKKSIPVFLDELFSHIGGNIDVAEYALPGSEELAKNVVKVLKDKNAVLLSNHGAVCCGKSLEDAFEIAEILERICKIYILSSILGGIKELPEEGIEYQRAIFEMEN